MRGDAGKGKLSEVVEIILAFISGSDYTRRMNTTNPIDKAIIARHAPNCQKRAALELQIVRAVLAALNAAGYEVDYVDYGEDEVVRGHDDSVVAAIFDVDYSTLVVKRDGKRFSVSFACGNDGWDVMEDYSVSLESALAPVIRLSETLSK